MYCQEGIEHDWSPNHGMHLESVGILPGLRSKREERTPGGAPKTLPWLGFLESIWFHEDSEVQRFISGAVETGYGNPKFAWHCMANPENIQ